MRPVEAIKGMKAEWCRVYDSQKYAESTKCFGIYMVENELSDSVAFYRVGVYVVYLENKPRLSYRQ